MSALQDLVNKKSKVHPQTTEPLVGFQAPQVSQGQPGFEQTTGKFVPTDIPRTIFQGITQSGAKVALALTDLVKRKKEATSLKLGPGATGFEKSLMSTLFGTEEVTGFATDVAQLEQLAKPYLGKPGQFAIAPVLIGLTALDFTLFGGGKKGAIEALLKAKTVKETAPILKAIGVADDLIPSYATKFATTTERKVIEEGLQNLEKITKTTKAVEPLAQEARKYKSAEEFQIATINKGLTGKYWHITDSPELKISKEISPRDLSTMAIPTRKGGFTVTSNPQEWADSMGIAGKSRKYISEIDLSKLKEGVDYSVANRGFGQELFINKDALNKVNVVKTIPLEEGLKEANQYLKNISPNLFNVGGKSQLTDFYRQAKGVKEAIPTKLGALPTVPELKPKITKSVAQEAIDYVKSNPESSLVSKGIRNPRTKELIAGPRLFKQIGEAIRVGEIDINRLPAMIKQYGLSAEETARLFEDAATYSGRTLGALARVEKEIRALLPDIQIAKRVPTMWERFKSGYLAVDNFRRGLLVTQMATAARNAISQSGRYTIGTITDGMNGVISKIVGKGEGFTPFLEDIAAVFRKMTPGNTKRLQQILQKFPIEDARLYNTPVGDVALAGKITNTLNTLNRGQEYFFRNLILDAKLNAAAKFKKVPIEKLGIEDFTKAVDEALDWTFSKSPIRGSFGNAIMRAYNTMPPLTLINPFPRFMSNAVKFLWDYSPGGLTSLLRAETRAAIAAGDYATISKAIVGTMMLGAAATIRANPNLAGEKWYEIKVGDRTIDMRPFAPFSTYLFFAEMMVNGTDRITGSDWAQATISVNRVAGTGLVLIDLISDKVDYKNAKQILGNLVSTYVGGFTVPFRTISDIVGNFRLEERTLKETREIPIIGSAISNIPLLQEQLPTKYSLFQDKPLQRESPLLRQLTGLTLTTKPFIQKELDRMGKSIGDLIPKTGNLTANRIISKQTGVILDKFNDKLKLSEKYKAMDDEQKLEIIKTIISEGKKEAKGEMASDLAGVVYNELLKSNKVDRKKTLSDLKNRGLLTESITDYLAEMLIAQPLPK